MNWPWRRKSNPANRLIVLGLNITGPVRHEDWESLSRRTYERNATVFSCVSGIARACSTVHITMPAA